MAIAILLFEAACLALLTIHLTSVVAAIVRCRPRPYLAARRGAAGVTLLRPVCGLDNFAEETLRSSFELDYPHYEIIFCAAHAHDPAVPLVRRLIAAYPGVNARLLIGDERISHNPKLNNMLKGWHAAAHEWVVIADSNVLMPRDYVQRLLAAWRADTGLICSPPIGCMPSGFWAELECAFLNTYQARWQYFADSLGFGFSQGKTMLWRREELNAAGGLRALATELAEDAASTKVVRQNSKRVRLVDAPFDQPLGRRTMVEVWRRQLRWAGLRRAAFPLCYLSEILTGGIMPIFGSGILLVAVTDISPLAGVSAIAVLWYGAEAALAYAARWHLSARDVSAWLARDLMIPALWIAGWLGNEIVWRGNQMDVADSGALQTSPAAVSAESGDRPF